MPDDLQEVSSFHEAYEVQAQTTPDALAVVCVSSQCPRCELTYLQVCRRAEELARGLARLLHRRSGEDVARPRVGIHVPRTDPDFLPLLLAASHCDFPFVLMSTDLPNKELEVERNTYILKHLSLAAVIRPDEPESELVQIGVSQETKNIRILNVATLCGKAEAAEAEAEDVFVPAERLRTDRLLALMFTGGSRRMKVVKVTHDMILHELRTYPKVAPLVGGDSARVLVNSSVFWPAATMGQLSVALAYSACAVITDVTEVLDLRKLLAAEHVDVFGMVPDMLGLLSECPAQEFPWVRIVFAWAERLPRSIAARWEGHPRALFRELLISTEYWLSFHADPLDSRGSIARPVSDAVKVCVLDAHGQHIGEGGIGELCLRGPMVTSGYLTDVDNRDAFITFQDRQYFRTRDVVQVVDGGFIFRGRADLLTKEKGQWVDMGAIEHLLQDASGVAEACIVPNPNCPAEFHAFLALRSEAKCAATIGAIRALLPWRTSIHIVLALPRNSVTGKVNMQDLQQRLACNTEASWPISGRFGASDTVPAALRLRLDDKVRSHAMWTAAALAVAVGCWDVRSFWSLVFRHRRRRALWRMSSSPFGLLTMAYTWLVTLHWTSWRKGSASTLFYELPFGRFGALACLHMTRSFSSATHGLLTALSLAGACLAWHRGRLFSWPLIFWAGVGNQLEMEGTRWLRKSTWWRQLSYAFDGLDWFLDAVYDTGHSAVRWSARKMSYVLHGTNHEPHFANMNWQRRFLRSVGTQWEWWPVEDSELVEQAKSLAAKLGVIPIDATTAEERSEQGTEKSGFPVHSPKAAIAHQEKDGAIAAVDVSDGVTSTEAASSVSNVDGEVGSSVEGDGVVSAHVGEASDSANTDSSCSMLADDAGGREGDTAGRALGTILESSDFSAAEEPSRSLTTGDLEPRCASHEPPSGSQPVASQHFTSSRESGKDAETGSSWQYHQWWWQSCTRTTVDISSQAVSWAEELLLESASQPEDGSSAAGPDSGACDVSAHVDESVGLGLLARRLLDLVGRTNSHLCPVTLATPLWGMDSLRVSMLANSVSSELGVALSSTAIREAKIMANLVQVVEKAPSSSSQTGCGDLSLRTEHSLWFTPGQFQKMGPWVMRSDDRVDRVAMQAAVAQLVDRHPALRTQLADPQALRSFMLNVATMFSIVGSFWPFWLRRCFSAALCAAWPRVRVQPRTQHFAGAADRGGGTPFSCIQVRGGQCELEQAFSARKWEFSSRPPFDVALFELQVPVAGVWNLEDGRHISVIRHDDTLVYVDVKWRHAGILLSPQDSKWPQAPTGFPALYAVRLNDGGAVWLRWEHADEIRICYKRELQPAAAWQCCSGTRNTSKTDHHEQIFFLRIQCFHSFADGYCFSPIAGDLLDMYHARVQGRMAELRFPPVGTSFRTLERRLFDTLRFQTESADRHSLRGGLWSFHARGYSHTVYFETGIVSVLKMAAARYALPMNYLFLALVIVAMARASSHEMVEMTLYVPMRDGSDEAAMVGLFADWRDISVRIAKEDATVLGVVLQVADILRLRRWSVFNALRKPERTVVNFDSQDPRRHGSFKQLSPGLWEGGDTLGMKVTRSDQLDWVHQPMQLDIGEESSQRWHLYMRMAYHLYPPSWTRRFIRGLEEASWDVIFHPSERVHKPYRSGYH